MLGGRPRRGGRGGPDDVQAAVRKIEFRLLQRQGHGQQPFRQQEAHELVVRRLGAAVCRGGVRFVGTVHRGGARGGILVLLSSRLLRWEHKNMPKRLIRVRRWVEGRHAPPRGRCPIPRALCVMYDVFLSRLGAYAMVWRWR